MGFSIKIIFLWLINFLKIIFKSSIKIAWILILNLILLIYFSSIYIKKIYPKSTFNEIIFNILPREDIIFFNVFLNIILPTILTSLIILLINENIRKNFVNNKNLILNLKKTKNSKMVNLFERNKDYILKFNLFKKFITIKIKRKAILLILILFNLSFISFFVINSANNLEIEEYLKNFNFKYSFFEKAASILEIFS